MPSLKIIVYICAFLIVCSNANALPTVSITEVDEEAAEAGQATGSFTVTRTGDENPGQILQVYFSFGPSPEGPDFNFSAGLGYQSATTRSIPIPANQLSATVTITPVRDNLIEGLETLEIALSARSAYTLGDPAQASIEITDDVAEVRISAVDADAAEAGQDPGSFTVTRSDNGNTGAALPVYFTFGPSPEGPDFIFSAGLGYIGATTRHVTIPANEFSATVIVTPVRDNLIEGLETLEITLSDRNTHTLGDPAQASIEITDDVAEVRISAVDADAAEAGQDPGSFTVTRSDNGNTGAALPVYFTFGPSPEGPDFIFSAGLGYIGATTRHVTIPANEFSATVIVTPVRDNLIEGLETLEITLSDRNTHTLGDPAQASIEITDDVAEVRISAVDADAAEAGQDPGSFTVTRSDNGNTGAALPVYFTFGPSPEGPDFIFSAGLAYIGATTRHVTIPANEFSATVIVTPVRDNLIEGLETLEITLSDRNTHTLGDPAQASIEITDDVAEVRISAVDADAAEAGQDPGSFTVTRSDNGNTGAALPVYFTFGPSPEGPDFIFSAGLGYIGATTRHVTIPANEFSATVTITPIMDSNEEEGDEIVVFNLSDRNTHTLGTPKTAEITIADFVNLVFKDSFEGQQ